MNIQLKYTPVNIICNLMLVDLWQLKQIQSKALDDQLRAELILAIDSTKAELEHIFDRANEYFTPPHIQEDLAATACADCRQKFNVINLRNIFLEQGGKNFLIELTFRDKDGILDTKSVSTSVPYLVNQKLVRAVRDPSIVVVRVTLFKKRPDHIAWEQLYNFPTEPDVLARMLEINSNRYLDIAQITAAPEMILQFARRPPQECHNPSYWRAKTPLIQGGMMP